MARWRVLHRSDLSAKPLIAKAIEAGWQYHPLGGAIDGFLYEPWSQRVLLIDWKTPKAIRGKKNERTKTQQQLVERGCPLHFIENEAELLTLLGDR